MVFTDYALASQAAHAEGLTVVGFAGTDKPTVYLLVDRNTTDDELTDLAFEHLYGRPISDGERYLLKLMESRAAKD